MNYKSKIIITIFFLCAIILCACGMPGDDRTAKTELTPGTAVSNDQAAPTDELTPTPQPTPIKTTQPDVPIQDMPAETVLPDELPMPIQTDTASHEAGTVRVRPGDTLAKDIIPNLCDIFSLSEKEVKGLLEDCPDSKLINDGLSDFRRMEGIILPGKYEIAENESLSKYVNIWIEQAEERYDSIASKIGEINNLEPHEQLSLAAVIEWECLPNDYYYEVAAVFLNRLDNGSKLRSCATTEYALGFTRPYLTSDDIKIQSSYNTYAVRGVPIGPICAIEDDCLRAAIGKKTDSRLYYFFNDYARHEILVFSNYDDFKQAAAISRQLYGQTFDIDPYAKANKKEVFGYEQ